MILGFTHRAPFLVSKNVVEYVVRASLIKRKCQDQNNQAIESV